MQVCEEMTSMQGVSMSENEVCNVVLSVVELLWMETTDMSSCVMILFT